MFLQWGNYRFRQSEAATIILRTRLQDDAGNGWADLETWQLSGKLLNPSGKLATMTTAIRNLEAAFKVDGLDLIMFQPDGTPTAHSLRSADTIGGVRVTQPPSYPDGTGAQYVTFRDFSITLEGLVPLSGNRSTLKSFTESIQFSGGGPLTHHLEPLTGLPIKQLGKQATVWRAVQSGSAVGLVGRPSPLFISPPVWPDAEVIPLRTITSGTPRRVGNTFIDWPVAWQYTFESAEKLIGSPHLWSF